MGNSEAQRRQTEDEVSLPCYCASVLLTPVPGASLSRWCAQAELRVAAADRDHVLPSSRVLLPKKDDDEAKVEADVLHLTRTQVGHSCSSYWKLVEAGD